jgi:purine-binding chemotaxis protein CheW
MSASPAAVPQAASGRYLVFVLGGAEYAVDVLRVREITGPLPITRVPRMPPHVRGVINLRGQVIPVIDLRTRFGLEAVDHGARTCMIVLQAGAAEFTALVDRVCEVVTIAAGEVEETPSFGAAVDTAYLQGVVRAGPRVRLLLDIDRVLSVAELGAAAAVAGAPAAGAVAQPA